jgi:hypothetical protein
MAAVRVRLKVPESTLLVVGRTVGRFSDFVESSSFHRSHVSSGQRSRFWCPTPANCPPQEPLALLEAQSDKEDWQLHYSRRLKGR